MGRRRFAAQHFLALLRLIDEELTEPATVTVIGGAALGLVCLEQHLTTDLDVEAMTNEAFWQAVRRAQARLEDPPVVESVSIAQPPYDYEDRLTRLPLGCRHRSRGSGRPDPREPGLTPVVTGEARSSRRGASRPGRGRRHGSFCRRAMEEGLAGGPRVR